MNVQTNTFLGGMDRDSDIHFVKDSSYRYAENVRIITENNGTQGVLQNIKASKDIELTGDEFIGDIICIHSIDKYIILITVEDSINRIYRCVEEENGLNLTCILTSDMGLTTDSRISLVNCVESQDNIKLYIACKEHYLRIIDILKNYGQIDNSVLDINPSFVLPELKFESLGKGKLKSGSVQYFYQLFNPRYNNTSYSTLTPLIHVHNIPTYTSSDQQIVYGVQKEQDTDVCVNLKLQLNDNIIDNFSHIRLFKVKYDSVNDVPKISIVTESLILSQQSDFDITTNNEFFFSDNVESTVSQITIEELNQLNVIFKSATIETKNNILFTANVQQEDFDVDYDARAYRLNPELVLKVYNNGKVLQSDQLPGTIVGRPNIEYVDTMCRKLIETDDCLCPYNITTDPNDDDYQYQYNTNHKLGGYGLNVEYEFITKDIYIDCLLDHDFIIAQNNDARKARAASSVPSINSVPADEKQDGNKDYSNPEYNVNYVGYTRSEIYRFGIVFFNDKNQASPVHWIGDIKMPDYKASLPFTQEKIGDFYRFIGHALGIKFKLKNIPEEVKYYKIVRCERKSKDRTIVSQGVLSRTLDSNYNYNFLTGVKAFTTNQTYPAIPLTFAKSRRFQSTSVSQNYTSSVEKACVLISSEIDYGKDGVIDNLKNNKIQILGVLGNIQNGKTSSGLIMENNSGPYYRRIASNKIDNYYATTIESDSVNITEVYLGDSSPRVTNILSKKYNYMSPDSFHIDYGMKLNIDEIVIPDILKQNDIEDLTPFYNQLGGRNYINVGKAATPSGSSDTNTSYINKLGYFGKHAAITLKDDITNLYYNIRTNEDQFGNATRNMSYIPAMTTSYVYLVNVINEAYPYEGYNNYSRQNSVYISISSGIYSPETTEVEVYGGDTYLSILDHKTCNVIPNLNNTSRNQNYSYISCVDYIPVESTINHCLTHGENTNKNIITYDSTQNMNSFLGTEIANGNVTGEYAQSKPYCVYNDAYSVEPFAKKYVSKDMYSITNNYNYNRVYASDVKTNNEVNNSWLNFRQANYIDVEQLGQITNLKSYKDRLLFFQDSAVGVLSVNDRSLITDNNISSLVLGTGDVLSRYDYITKYNGSSIVNDSSIVDSFYGLYWYDYDNKSVVALTDTITNLSAIKLVQSDFNNTTKKVKASVKDDEFKEIQLSFDDKVLVYNENTQNFSSYYTFNYDYCTKLNSNIYYVKDNIITKQSDESDCISKIQLIINQNPLITKVYDNQFFGGYFTDINNMLTDVTFDTKNQSGSIMRNINGEMMIDYREDTYRYAIGRSESDNAMSFAPRLRGKYLICDYTIDCTNNHNFILPNINTTYRQSLV